MSDFDFIVDNIRYSYSSASTFETCPYAFKLTYIDLSLPKKDNFYSQYGTLIHNCNEQYFSGKIEMFELPKCFNDNYDLIVTDSEPMGNDEKYRMQGEDFFNNFSLDRNDYDILLIEDKIDFDLNSHVAVAKPDLVMREKSSGIIGLYDYKTSSTFRIDRYTGKEVADTKKLEGYYRQMFIYTYALRIGKGIPVDTITLWFTRPERMVTIEWDEEKENQAIQWFSNTIDKIKKENLFPYNNKNSYFCNNLCGVRNFCEYR